MIYSTLFQETVDALEQAGIEDAQVDAIQIFEFCFGVNRSQFLLRQDQQVPDQDIASYKEVLRRRVAREPLQYITGVREFWSLEFYVSPAVLIPRPETEFLLDQALSKCRQENIHPEAVLDMCTGSGVIAVVLAQEFSDVTVMAVDKSEEALQLASRNFAKYKLTNRVQLICADLFSVFADNLQFDLIVANPPYVAHHYLETLQPEVKSWEPHSALFAGDKGLDVIMRLADNAYRHLHPGGWIFVEIGAEQGEDVVEIFLSHKNRAYEKVEVIPDWSGRPRVLQARKVQRDS